MDEHLSKEQYHILREKGTEPPFSGEYVDCKKKGTYVCAACGQKLFSSEDKYDSGSGWPSFFRPILKENVEAEPDNQLATTRIEVHCSNCKGHLGHVFEDGPAPTYQRYCVNSLSLKLKEEK